MVLTAKQRDELHWAIWQYLEKNNFSQSANQFKEEASVKVIDKKDENLLEDKWLSIVRLSKKTVELQARINQLTDEVENLSKNGIKSFQQDSGEVPYFPKLKLNLSGHRSAVNNVSFHPSYSILASASDDGTIRLWDYEEGSYETSLKGHQGHVQCVAFDPTGRYLASSSSDLTIKIWELKTNSCIKTLHGHEHSVSCIDFTPVGDFLLSASRDKMVRLWEVSTGFCKKTYVGHEDWVEILKYIIVVSSDGKQFATSSQDQKIFIWNTDSAQIVTQLEGHEHVVELVKYIPEAHTKKIIEKMGKNSTKKENGAQTQAQSQPTVQLLISCSRDRDIKIWNINLSTCIITLSGHDNWVNGVAFHPDGIHMYSVSDDKTLRTWDLVQQKCVRKHQDAHEKFICKVVFSPIKLLLATCSVDQTIKIWNFQ